MSPRVNAPLCQVSSRYGKCHRIERHQGVHASFVGDRAFWFAWIKDTETGWLGFGYFSHGRFQPAPSQRTNPDLEESP
jgi:hypothetical protein